MRTPQTADIFPEQLGVGAQFSREEQARALLKAYFRIAEEWSLSPNQARILLGNPGKSRFYDLRKGVRRAMLAVSDDEFDRLAYITGIYYGLELMFSPENARNWLCNTPDPKPGYNRPWGAVAPLAHMLNGKMESLIDVYRYVNGMRCAQ